MKETISVNPAVLRWARETAGLVVDDVVIKLDRKRITKTTILAWEDGQDSPSYSQLERLAYEVYKRPLALFFFPEPPEEEIPEQSFRTFPENEFRLMPPPLRLLIRRAKVMQLNLTELYDNVNPSSRQIVRDLSFNPGVSAEKMAMAVREYLKIDLATQIRWKDSDEALKAWRNAMESHGIFVFKDAFKIDDFSGFCLYEEQFPIIYVNNSKSKTRQIFTLFHELAHLLFRTGGVDTRLDNYIESLQGDNRRIEILCNSFAGEFLVPASDLTAKIKGMPVNDTTIKKLAEFYHVSREVILRKLFDRKLVNQTYYNNKVREWGLQQRKGSGAGGNYYLTKGAYLGERYLEQAFSRYYQKRITTEQLAEYLGVKEKSVPGMEGLLYDKGVPA
jgi:Zn-dependent peptidase ImmA (M78 family)/transcriptional regulator with XRE-family HTH domain